MATNTISGSALDDWLMEPDCPQCGSEDVKLIEEKPDGFGGTIKVWYCNKCGHTWVEK